MTKEKSRKPLSAEAVVGLLIIAVLLVLAVLAPGFFSIQPEFPEPITMPD